MFDIFSLQSRFYCAQAPLEVPQPDGAPKTYPPNITSIVDQISKLTCKEMSDRQLHNELTSHKFNTEGNIAYTVPRKTPIQKAR